MQAQELAAQIQADGRQLDKMAEALNAARLRSQQLATQLADLRAKMAQTTAAAAAARAALKQQAVMSYVVGGAPRVSSVPVGPHAEPTLAISYAEIVAGGEKRAVETYHRELATQTAESAQLAGAEQDVAVTVGQLQADSAAAAQADAARKQALSQVAGQLAQLVAQIQAQQQAAARNTVLTSSPGSSSSTPGRSSAPTTGGGSRPVTTENPVGAAPISARPPTTKSTPTTPPAPTNQGAGTGTDGTGGPPQAPGADKAIGYAEAQIGKPYQWGGAGPDSFDCSGLVMMAWKQAGVSFPHLAQDQYDMTARIPLAAAIPGDLIFYGSSTDVYHVGLYIGNGQMIDAPETGQNVKIQSIYWSDLLGAGRVT